VEARRAHGSIIGREPGYETPSCARRPATSTIALRHLRDGRSVVLRHTNAGRRILLDALEVMEGIEAEYADAIGADEVAQLKHLLSRLLAEIDPAGALDGGPHWARRTTGREPEERLNPPRGVCHDAVTCVSVKRGEACGGGCSAWLSR
jgi:hypothetical protein